MLVFLPVFNPINLFIEFIILQFSPLQGRDGRLFMCDPRLGRHRHMYLVDPGAEPYTCMFAGPSLGDIYIGCEGGNVHLWSTRQSKITAKYINQGAGRVCAVGWAGPLGGVGVVSAHVSGEVWLTTITGARHAVRYYRFINKKGMDHRLFVEKVRRKF